MTGQPLSAPPAHIGAVKPEGWAYSRAPMIIYWELTNACGLACRHCRATAQPEASEGELTTAEAIAVLDSVLDFGTPLPHVVMTGGDPLMRDDLWELLAAARDRGIGVSLAPAVTSLLNRESMQRMVDAGVQAISLSLDGSRAASHDGLRQVDGTFDATMQALDDAAAVGLNVQVNTLVTDTTAPELIEVFELLKTKTIMQWSLFFLISVGRGKELNELAPGEAEKLMIEISTLARTAPFRVKTTEAMQYRRITSRALMRQGRTREEIESSHASRGFGIRDGNGIVFLSHLGDVTPSGFLPLEVGNVRERSLVELYRDTELMQQLRDPDQFKGRCGVCEFHDWCGGSRSRAWAWTGDPLESDPLCPYVPPAWAQAHAQERTEATA